MPLTADQRRVRAQVAARAKHTPNDPETVAALTEFRTEALERHVRRVVDKAPPLSPEQRDRVAAVLRAPRDSGGAPAA